MIQLCLIVQPARMMSACQSSLLSRPSHSDTHTLYITLEHVHVDEGEYTWQQIEKKEERFSGAL